MAGLSCISIDTTTAGGHQTKEQGASSRVGGRFAAQHDRVSFGHSTQRRLCGAARGGAGRTDISDIAGTKDARERAKGMGEGYVGWGGGVGFEWSGRFPHSYIHAGACPQWLAGWLVDCNPMLSNMSARASPEHAHPRARACPRGLIRRFWCTLRRTFSNRQVRRSSASTAGFRGSVDFKQVCDLIEADKRSKGATGGWSKRKKAKLARSAAVAPIVVIPGLKRNGTGSASDLDVTEV